MKRTNKLCNTPNKEGTSSSSVTNRTSDKRAIKSRSPILTRSKTRVADDIESALPGAISKKSKRKSNEPESNLAVATSKKAKLTVHLTKLRSRSASKDTAPQAGPSTSNHHNQKAKKAQVAKKRRQSRSKVSEASRPKEIEIKPSTSGQADLVMDQHGGNDPSNVNLNSNTTTNSSSQLSASDISQSMNASTSSILSSTSYSISQSLDFDGEEVDMSRLQTILESRLHPNILGMPRMQNLIYRSFNPSSSKAQQLLQGLNASSSDSEKLQCVLDMCQLLLMGNEDTLVGFPIKTVVPALIHLLSMDSNFEIMHHACRALTYMMEALPRSSLVVLDAVPVFLEKLQAIQCMDVAEQSLSALEMLSRRHNKSILHARGVSACLTYLDFFSIDAQRSALTITANCFQNMTPEDFQYVHDSLPILSSHLTVDDKKCIENICLAFYRLIDCYQSDCAVISEVASPELLTNIQNVLMTVPPVLSSSSFVTVIRMLSIACSSCPQIAVELLKLNICETLKSLLLNNSSLDNGDSIYLISRGSQEIFEITSLIAELMPVLPLNGIFSVDAFFMRSSQSSIDQPIWQWKDERGVWHAFNAVDNKIIETAFQTGEDELELSLMNRVFIIDFNAMTKTYQDCRVTHSIQRKFNSAVGSGESTNRSNIPGADPRAEFIANEKELSTTFIKFIFGVLNEVYNNSAGTSIRYKCLNAILRILYYSPKDLLITILKDHSISSSIATMLASHDMRIVVCATQMCHILVEKLPDIFSVYFQREGVLHQIRKLYLEDKAPAVSSTTLEKKLSPTGNLASGSSSSTTATSSSGANRGKGTLYLSGSSHSLMLADPNSYIHNVIPPSDPLVDYMNAYTQSFSHRLASVRSAASSAEPNPSDDSNAKLHKRTKKSTNSHGSSRSGKVADLAEKKATSAAIVADSSSSMPTVFASEAADLSVLTSNISSSIANFPLFSETAMCPSSSKSSGSSSIKASSSKDFLQRLNPAKWAKWSQSGSSNSSSSTAAAVTQAPSNPSAASASYASSVNMAVKDFASLHKSHSANKDRIRAWIKEQAKKFDTTYFNKSTSNEKIMGSSANILTDLAEAIESLKQDPVKSLTCIKNILLESDLSSFELIHSGLVKNLLAFLVNKDGGEASREQNIRTFLHVFYGSSLMDQIDGLDELAFVSKPLSILIQKLNACVSQLEQFPLRLYDSNTSSSSRHSQSSSLKYMSAHLKISLNRHPSCSNLRKYKGPLIKLDAFTPVSSVERYLVSRGYGKIKDEDEQSDDDLSDEEIMENLSLSSSQLSKRQRIQIMIGDHVLPNQMTIYQAIKTHLGSEYPESENEADTSSRFWLSTFFLYYRLATDTGPIVSASTSRASSKLKSKSKSAVKKKDELWLEGKVPTYISPLEAYLKSTLFYNSSINDQSTETLCLLRVLYGINRYWGYLYRLPYHYNPAIPLKEFINCKLTVKANRQLQDMVAILTDSLPAWVSELGYACPFMFPFETRHLLFYVACFDRERAMQRLTEVLPDMNLDRNSLLPRLEKRKKTVSRMDIYKSAETLFSELGSGKALLEIQYENEVGTGLGPTLEFYALVSKEFQRAEFEMWKKDAGSHDVKSESNVSSSNGLFPVPIGRNLKQSGVVKLKQRFKLLGKFMAKALMDSRMIDLPLNVLFYKWLLNEESTLSIANINQIDPTFSMSIIQMFKIAQKKARENLKDNDDSLKLKGCSIQDLQLDFTLPGHPNIEMRKAGKEMTVDVGNLESYINLVCHWNLVEGVARQMEAFKEGFNSVFNASHLLLFYPEEMQQLFCGSSYKSWDYQMLMESCKTDHGFSHESQAIRFLFEILSTFNAEEQRKFLQFLTGSPRLPIGGFKALQPAFTIVRKYANDNENTDCLPSVMTCVNYLKLPDYPTIEIMREKLNIAINEGQFSFHLS